MKQFLSKHLFLLLVFAVIFLLFKDTFLHGLLPIPSDTIVGLYHPYRDLFVDTFPRGIPFKNFLITDPVRQIIPWKMLVIDQYSRGQLPLWNPYEMTGKPLLANFQSGVFYPGNVLLFIKPFFVGWTILIFLQQIGGVFFLYLYLTNLKIDRRAAAFGALAWVFSGFFIVWLEWGNIIHTVLWLPLILLAIDKIVVCNKYHVVSKKNILWNAILIFSLCFSLFAGHLQSFFYLYLLCLIYFLVRWFQSNTKLKILFTFLVLNFLFIIITSVQWLPTLQFIFLSARGADQSYLTAEGWFLPYKHLIQFFAPDFFGNPTTLNYWGTWNYGEMTGYFGLIPFVFALFAAIFRRDKKSYFFATVFLVSLLFALPTVVAKLPYQWSIPFLSSAQPTRLLMVTVFAGAVLAAFGLDYFLMELKDKKKSVFYQLFAVLILVALVLIGLWLVVIMQVPWLGALLSENWAVAKRNLILPTAVYGALFLIVTFLFLFKTKKIIWVTVLLLFIISAFDLYRFGEKFLPFTDSTYLFPRTKITSFLQNQRGLFRFSSLNNEIFPPNFSTVYHLQSIEGYDPLYLMRYGQFVSVFERNSADSLAIQQFNRIITPHNYQNPLFDSLNTTYIASFDPLPEKYFMLVKTEGQTKLYKNKNAYERAFFVKTVKQVKDSRDEMKAVFQSDLHTTAIVSQLRDTNHYSIGTVSVKKYSENEVILETDNEGDGFLVQMDAYYPTWTVSIDGKKTLLLRTNFAFRGVVVPKGKHTVIFKNHLF